MCDLDFDESPAVWSELQVRARKQHKCSCCEGLIRPGEKYVKHFSVFAHAIYDEKQCAPCTRMVEAFKEAHEGQSYNPSSMDAGLDGCIDNEEDADRRRYWVRKREEMRARKAAASVQSV